jgi:hypothetical protein
MGKPLQLNMGVRRPRASMPRKLSPEQQLELDSLYRVIGTITEWYDELAAPELRGQMSDALRRAHEKRDLRGLRMAYNDLVEMTNAATVAQRRDLDGRLRARANTTLEALSARKMQRIGRIRARGKLTSEEQYYLIREYVEFSFDDPEKADEVTELLAMLDDYEVRSALRAKARGARPASDEGGD